MSVGNLSKKFPIGCAHVSAKPKFKYFLARVFKKVGAHYAFGLSEFDYLKKYTKYFPEYLSLELENDFEKQLEIKKYIENNILLN